jgi:hypothetical protein
MSKAAIRAEQEAVATMADEPRYTLEEAKQIIVEEHCRDNGHQLAIATNADNDPIALGCGVCGHNGTITWNKEKP